MIRFPRRPPLPPPPSLFRAGKYHDRVDTTGRLPTFASTPIVTSSKPSIGFGPPMRNLPPLTTPRASQRIPLFRPSVPSSVCSDPRPSMNLPSSKPSRKLLGATSRRLSSPEKSSYEPSIPGNPSRRSTAYGKNSVPVLPFPLVAGKPPALSEPRPSDSSACRTDNS